jgi:cation transport ATPase
MSKTPGSQVLSGSINGETALIIRATRRAVDSRYAQIMRVMQESEQRRPQIRRLADQLGALYTPLAVAIAIGASELTHAVKEVENESFRTFETFLIATVVYLACSLVLMGIGAWLGQRAKSAGAH